MAHALDLLSSVMTSAGADRSLVGALPGGPALLSDLSAATNASIRTDQDYGAWLGDLQATGCYGGPTNDLHYKAGAAASVIAERADQRLADAWAPIASAKKAPVWLPSQI
jgi:hypothetical protein